MEKQGKAMGKARESKGGTANKANKEKQGPDPARKSLRSGSPLLLHPVAFRKNGEPLGASGSLWEPMGAEVSQWDTHSDAGRGEKTE